MGKAIRKAMKTERFRALIHTRAKMTKEATGVDLMPVIKGRTKVSRRGNRWLAAAKAPPKTMASRNPRLIRPKELAMDLQKRPVAARRPKALDTAAGEARRISCPTATLPAARPPARRGEAKLYSKGGYRAK